jgi:hypothetical protein
MRQILLHWYIYSNSKFAPHFQLSQEDNASKASLISQVIPFNALPHLLHLPSILVLDCPCFCRDAHPQLQATIAARDASIKELEDQARADAQERRKLHNMVQELKGEISQQQRPYLRLL